MPKDKGLKKIMRELIKFQKIPCRCNAKDGIELRSLEEAHAKILSHLKEIVPTKDEIEDIIKDHYLYIDQCTDESGAAEAIHKEMLDRIDKEG